jgi:cobalt/nickel transport system permease protein
MHVPDGFIDLPVSIGAGSVAAGAIAVGLRSARRELDERTAPLAGLVAVFVFAMQLMNFPIAAGTSGHLLGAVLAAVLVGPYTGVLCIAVVLLVQGVVFADGGLTALGVNITDMAVIGLGVGYLAFLALRAVLPTSRAGIVLASAGGAFVSVPAAASGFVALYALGGTSSVPAGTVFTAMVSVHLLIGVGEALITAFTVSTVLAVRPDLVHGAGQLRPRASLALRQVPPMSPDSETLAVAGATHAADPVVTDSMIQRDGASRETR